MNEVEVMVIIRLRGTWCFFAVAWCAECCAFTPRYLWTRLAVLTLRLVRVQMRQGNRWRSLGRLVLPWDLFDDDDDGDDWSGGLPARIRMAL